MAEDNSFVFKSSVKNHFEIKEKILQEIELIPQNKYQSFNTFIDHTDWNLPSNIYRGYFNILLKAVGGHLDNIKQSLKTDNFEIINYWFQQYKNNSFHGWHTHTNAHFANVYLVECPKDSQTMFRNFKIDCKEGDIISFPAFLPHCSAPLQSEQRKTIISFNSNFYCDHD